SALLDYQAVFLSRNCQPLLRRRKAAQPDNLLPAGGAHRDHRPGTALGRRDFALLEQFLDFLGGPGVPWPEAVARTPISNLQRAFEAGRVVSLAGMLREDRPHNGPKNRARLGYRHFTRRSEAISKVFLLKGLATFWWLKLQTVLKAQHARSA